MHDYRSYRADRRFQPYVAMSPDGTEVAYSDDRSGQFNLVVTPLAGGPDRLVTNFDDVTVREAVWAPDGRHLIFVADKNGDELYQLYRVAAEGGPIEALTDNDKVQYLLGTVSPDGRYLAYAGNDRDEAAQDVLVQDLVTGELHRPYSDGGNMFAAAWASDSRRLLGVRYSGPTQGALFLLDLDGKPEQLLPPPGEPEFQVEPGPWLPDGSGFLVRTDVDREFVGVARYDLATRELHWLLTPDWDVEHVDLSVDGRLIVWTVNASGVSELHAAEYASLGANVELPTLGVPAGPISALSINRAGTAAALIMSTGSRPTNVATVDLVAGSSSWVTDAWATAKGSVEPTLVHVTAYDGRQIPAWLYRPEGDGPHPIVLSVHGGPEGQERPGYNYAGLYQYLLSRGIGVVAPNVRGSTGYGREYQRLIMRDWGGDDLRDFEAVAVYARALDWVDPAGLGVFGASYGGFVVLSCLSRLPQLFACGVDMMGPSSLVTLTSSVPPTWRSMMAARIGDPETEADFLMSRSPITYVDQIVAPLFVIQGAKDPRVRKAESDGIVAALRNRGVDVRYDVYEDEGHGFTRPENEAKALGDAADFFITHLRGAG
ncbi:MAG TPA: prolyl oligopeptidase family serine peptidase [Actinomycetales bacterium]|nr:prolyl oligopeptidase family serine peptidase [Actinomycetales bacterium]